MTNTNSGDPINWTGDEDPVTASARRAGQAIAQTADRAFQVAYMIQVMRTQAVQEDLARLTDGDANHPESEHHAQQLNANVAAGDLVLAHDPTNPDTVRAARVDAVNPDGRITVTLSHQVELQPGHYQVLDTNPTTPPTTDRAAATNPSRATETDRNRPGPDPQAPGELTMGQPVQALDRGNIGTIVGLDGDEVVVNFNNAQTGANRDVTLKRSQVVSHQPPSATNPKPPTPPPTASGLLRPDGKPDPQRIAKTQASRPPGPRPASQTPKPAPRRRPPGPKPGT